jgi:hypothetical protein
MTLPVRPRLGREPHAAKVKQMKVHAVKTRREQLLLDLVFMALSSTVVAEAGSPLCGWLHLVDQLP